MLRVIVRERSRRRRLAAAFGELQSLESRIVLSAAPALFSSPAELQQFLVESAVERWRESFGTRFDLSPRGGVGIGGGRGTEPVALASGTPQSAAAPSAAKGSPGFSQTNTQVAGVDEGDIVETDGNYLYVFSGRTVKVVDARDPSKLAVIATETLDDAPIAEYLAGSRLTVVSQSYGDVMWLDGGGGVAMASAKMIAPGIMPPYRQTTPRVTVSEFDVSDPSDPYLTRQTKFDGNYLDSRAVGDQVYLVLDQWMDYVPQPEISYTSRAGWYESEMSYRARLATLDLTANLPKFEAKTLGADGSTIATASGPIESATSIYKPVNKDDNDLVSVIVIDTAKTGPAPASAIGLVTNYAGQLYMNAEHLYLASANWSDDAGGSSTTTVRKLNLGDDSVTFTAIGSVPGQVLNQFSMDEQGGFLRIATTRDFAAPDGNWTSTNNLYVLVENDGGLHKLGSLEGLAPGERLYAARFVGDTAYLETFRQTDPLFVVNLTDPAAPKVLGELKIDGFSRYLQPIDATHLIGIGRDADPETGRAHGLQVALFDVSDPAAPKRTSVFQIDPGAWTWSDAEYDHHAVAYFPETQTLAIPVNGYARAAKDSDDFGSYISGVWVFKVDAAAGLSLRGTVAHDAPVQRSVRIGDSLITLTQNDIKASKLDEPGTTLGQVTLHAKGDPEAWQPYPIALDVVATPTGFGTVTDPAAGRPAGGKEGNAVPVKGGHKKHGPTASAGKAKRNKPNAHKKHPGKHAPPQATPVAQKHPRGPKFKAPRKGRA